MGLEVKAQVEDRLRQEFRLHKNERYEQSTDTAIPIQEGMDALELDMGQGCRKKRIVPSVFRVDEALKVAHAILDEFGRRRDMERTGRARAAYPILTAPKIARGFVGTAARCQKYAVDLAYEPIGYRHAATQPLDPVIEGGHIAGHLRDVVQRHPCKRLLLEKEKI
jgi:hypothetical protein